MAHHHGPTALSRTTTRAVVAATAVAATATMTVAAPGAANATIIRPNLPGAGTITQTLGNAPLLPGALPRVAIPFIAAPITQLTDAWTNDVPVLGSAIPIRNYQPNFPGWPGWGDAYGSGDLFTVEAPFQLGTLTNLTYGVIGSDLIGSDGQGSVGGDVTTVAGPFGGALSVNTSLTGYTDFNTGLARFTPAVQISAIPPFGPGQGFLTFSPGGIEYGDDTFLIDTPSLAVGALGSELFLNSGQVGFQDGNAVAYGPYGDATIANPLDPTTTIATGVFTGGQASIGQDGVTVNGPIVHAETDGPGGTGTVDAYGGGFSLDPDPANGVTVTAPYGQADLDTAAGSVAGGAYGGVLTANENSIGLGDGDPTLQDGIGGKLSINGGDTFHTSTNAEGVVTTDPSLTLAGDTGTTVGDTTIVDESGSQTIP